MEKEGMGLKIPKQKRQCFTVRVGRNGEFIINPKFLPCLEIFINF